MLAMTKKLRLLLPGLLLLVVQLPILWAVVTAAGCARLLWAETLGGARLPVGTTVALQLGWAIPVVVAAAVGLLLLVAGKKQNPCLGWLLGVVMGETLLLALFALGLVEPTLGITWNLRLP